MREPFFPYVIFLPVKRKQKVLRAIFGSKVPIDILKFSIDQGISEKIYQKNLIESLGHSNKTVIGHLKTMTDLGVLKENMEKIESDGRIVWMKYYVLSDLGKWFALLLTREDTLSQDEKAEIVRSVFRSYIKWVKELSEKLHVNKEILREIFLKEME
jgi:predicted transcriptional regulator